MRAARLVVDFKSVHGGRRPIGLRPAAIHEFSVARKEIAEGVYSFIAPESDSGVVQANCTVIIAQDAALMVDTGQLPSLAKRMVADIRKFTDKPVRYALLDERGGGAHAFRSPPIF